MTQPMSIYQRLCQLSEASPEAENLRFLVATEQGLQHLTLKQLLAAVPQPETTTEPVIVQASSDERLPQIMALLADHAQQLGSIGEEVSDIQADLIKRLKKADKVPFVPEESVALGLGALEDGAVDRENVAVGIAAGAALEGAGNVMIGPYAGAHVDGQLMDCTFVGHAAGFGGNADLENVTAVGAYARATGDNQVALGDHQSNVVTHSAAHRRQDARDMYQPKPSQLGLDFVLAIQPVEYREDFRDAYIDWDSKPCEPEALRPRPEAPTLESSDPEYQGLLVAYRSDLAIWLKEEAAHAAAVTQYHTDLTQWIDDNRLARINANGEHAGTRTHYGFNAAQVLEMCQRYGIDPAFVQDHAVKGGESVKTIADAELVPILWQAIHDMHRRFNSPEFIDELASALYQRHQTLTEATQAQTPVGSDLPAEQ